MPKEQTEKIKLIAKFLDKTKIENFDKLTTIDSILNLQISAFNFLNDADINLIEEYFQIKNIGQFSLLDPEHPFQILYKDPLTQKKIEQLLLTDLEIEDKIKKAIVISNVTHKIKEESISLTKKEQKVIVVGLSNAGKTTIFNAAAGRSVATSVGTWKRPGPAISWACTTPARFASASLPGDARPTAFTLITESVLASNQVQTTIIKIIKYFFFMVLNL